MISCESCGKQACGSVETMIEHYGWRNIDGDAVCNECSKALAEETARLALNPPTDFYMNRKCRWSKKEQTDPASYYTLNGIECKDIIGGLPAFVAFAMKYLFRAGKKAGSSYESDIQKAINYLNFELERIKKQ